jgi:hypothetical protein
MDVRVRVYHDGELLNLHVLAVPLRERHTGEAMFNACCALLDPLCPSWKSKLLSISTDGDRSMVGAVRGVSTRLELVALPGFIRVWCGVHQLDLVMQKVFKSLCDGTFYSKLTDLISYLGRKTSLIEEMGCKCP